MLEMLKSKGRVSGVTRGFIEEAVVISNDEVVPAVFNNQVLKTLEQRTSTICSKSIACGGFVTLWIATLTWAFEWASYHIVIHRPCA